MPNVYPGILPPYRSGQRLLCLLAVLFYPFLLFSQPTVSSVTPLSGPVGTSVTITGSNFSPTPGADIVFFGSSRASVTAASATSLTVTIPAGTNYQPVTVTTGGLTAFSWKPFITTFPDPGQFTTQAFASRTDYSTGDGPQSIFATDFDGDGKPDLVVADGDSNTVEIYRNTSTSGTISFSLVYDYILPSGYYPAAITAGDLDGDGKPDIVMTNATSPNLAVFLNTSTAGNISMATPTYLPQGNYTTGATIGDCNGDGKPEIVVANLADNTIEIYPNTSTIGAISFSTTLDTLRLPSGTLPYAVAIGDFDGDGMPDLASTDFLTANVSVWHNTGTAGGPLSFAANVNFGVGNRPQGLAVGDLDGDGLPDLVVVNTTDNTISLLHNTSTSGTISFVKGTDQPVGNNPDAVAINDFDGDGQPDVAVANLADNTVSVLRNTSTTGNIVLSTHVDYPTNYAPVSVVGADLDGDGMPDLALADNNGGSITVLRDQSPSAAAITNFTPTAGINGTVVTITGINLTGATAVSFGGTPATTFTVVSSTTITATVGAGTSGIVSVVTPAGTATLSGFTYGLPQPSLTSFSPTSGTTGAQITIMGTNLSGVTSVSFGGIPASSFAIQNDNEITAIVASGATGAVNVTSSAGSSALPGFTYSTPQPLAIYSFSPTSGTTGTNITIKGVGLSVNPTVSFGDVPAQSVTVFSDTLIVATVAGGASGDVTVIGGSGADSVAGFTYIVYTPPPPPANVVITSFTPTQGGAGTSVTITGTGLLNATGVSFGGVAAVAFRATSDSQIVAVVSNGSSGYVKVANLNSADSLSGFVYVSTDTSTHTSTGNFELVQFTGVLNGNKPQLSWTTLYDAGIAFYAIERGVDGSHFTVIDTVPSVGTGNVAAVYNYTDSNPRAGINFYRLKMQDTTVTYTYSDPISLDLIGVAMPVYPNPVKYGFFLVDLPAIDKPSIFRLTDMHGTTIQTLMVPAGVGQQRINVPGVLPGSYQLSWTNGMQKAYQTILILRQ